MHYLIDGYNLLFRLSGHSRSLEKQRQEVISWLNAQALNLKLDITVVFDASLQKLEQSHRGHFEALEIVYTSKNQSADEYIFEEVSRSAHPSQEIVVTSDRELASRCKILGAKIQTIESFFSWLIRKKSKQLKKKKATAAPSLQKNFKNSEAELLRLQRIFEKRLQDLP